VNIYRPFPRVLRPALLSGLAVASLLMTDATVRLAAEPAAQAQPSLVDLVRDATRPFLDVRAAEEAGYQPLFGCVSGPQEGAMGVHYINLALVKDPALDPAHPEALMYEFKEGRARLLGVEFIVDAATWLAANAGVPPALEGQAFHLVASPNRYALASFFELHVWAWRGNPNGTFVDWNPRVTCGGR
jgi:hypothetical protein